MATIDQSYIKMPLIVKDFTWEQSLEKVHIEVPLHGRSPNQVEIFTSPKYINASCNPLFFEAILLHPIDISQSTCLKTTNVIIFDLTKLNNIHWATLEVEGITKQERIAQKLAAIEEEHKRIQKEVEEKFQQKIDLKRNAVNEQIILDTKKRETIEELKKVEEQKALGDINQWKQKLKPVKLCAKPTNSNIVKPRQVKSLQILFTPREFPTPSRESRRDEEVQYLTKQAEARRSCGFVSEDLRPEEKNPDFILEKGKQYLKIGNFLGAISAFSFGIQLSPNFVDFYLFRSEAHIQLENYGRAAEDCSKALSLYKPVSPCNLQERAICLGRRGLALWHLGYPTHSISELDASLKLVENAEYRVLKSRYEEESKFNVQ